MVIVKALSFVFLRASQIKIINRRIEGASSFVRDQNMLDSAVDSPINQQHYSQENDLTRLAAALSYKFIKNHAFANGNKRTALLAANLFLLQNGKILQQDALQVEENDTITQAHDDVAMGKVEELELAEIYRRSWGTAIGADHMQAASLCEELDQPTSPAS